jgi:hypothetical protein
MHEGVFLKESLRDDTGQGASNPSGRLSRTCTDL